MGGWRVVRRKLSSEDLVHALDRHAALAHRGGAPFTEPERTSPASKMPGRLVSIGPRERLMSFHDGASATGGLF
jgi:hypothetical protein